MDDRLVDYHEVRYKGMTRSASDIMDFFYFKFMDTPLLSRMDAVMDYFTDEYETLTGRNISEEGMLEIKEKFDRMYVTKDIYEIYNWLLEEYGYPELPKKAPEKRVLAYEDVYPILYLKYRLCANTSRRNIRHLVIDEMQDYSYLQYVILSKIFNCNMTILGDKAQTVDDKMQDVLKFLPKIFGKKIRKIEMNKSYRNTTEIAEYARRFSEEKDVEYLDRHGKEVEVCQFEDRDQAIKDILEKVSVGPDGYETAAILTMTEAEAESVYEYLRTVREDVTYIDRDSSRFNRGITVTTFYMAKGLEFDQVFVLEGEKENPLYGQFQYISATRALHELYVLEKMPKI